MSNAFKTYKLSELATILAGGDLPDSYSTEKTNLLKIPVYSNGEKENGLYGYTDIPKITEPAVTISARGSKVGFAAIRKEPFLPIVRLISLIPHREILDVNFLFYNLKQNRQIGTGSGQPQITIPDISNRTISVPSLSTQQKIASVLSALDNKIELNNKINDNLEQLAKTIYDYWFVQFDFPDANGKPYKSSGGKMVYNEVLKREVPEGWEVKSIEEILSKSPSSIKINAKEYLTNGKIPIIDQSTDFICGFTNNNSAVIKGSIKPYIVFGDHTRIIKFINFDFARGADGTQVLNSNLVNMPQHLFYFSVSKIDLSNYGYARHFKFLKSQLLVVPSLEIANSFEKKAAHFYNLILSNSLQNQHLSQLRDWLLPMLMNGQVRID